jgi:copper ion binding protein
MPVTNTYTVTGMTCGHCVQAVTDELGRLPGVREVRVELETGEVAVTSDGPLPVDEVRGAVDEAGYDLAGAGADA